jgi:hypothetical protein
MRAASAVSGAPPRAGSAASAWQARCAACGGARAQEGPAEGRSLLAKAIFSLACVRLPKLFCFVLLCRAAGVAPRSRRRRVLLRRAPARRHQQQRRARCAHAAQQPRSGGGACCEQRCVCRRHAAATHGVAARCARCAAAARVPRRMRADGCAVLLAGGALGDAGARRRSTEQMFFAACVVSPPSVHALACGCATDWRRASLLAPHAGGRGAARAAARHPGAPAWCGVRKRKRAGALQRMCAAAPASFCEPATDVHRQSCVRQACPRSLRLPHASRSQPRRAAARRRRHAGAAHVARGVRRSGGACARADDVRPSFCHYIRRSQSRVGALRFRA